MTELNSTEISYEEDLKILKLKDFVLHRVDFNKMKNISVSTKLYELWKMTLSNKIKIFQKLLVGSHPNLNSKILQINTTEYDLTF
jgi:hypothetical protein